MTNEDGDGHWDNGHKVEVWVLADHDTSTFFDRYEVGHVSRMNVDETNWIWTVLHVGSCCT